MKRKISILGSTGSIGISTLNIIDKKKKLFEVYLLLANKNYKVICHQIKKYNPKYFIVSDQRTFNRVLKKFKKRKTKILNNLDKSIVRKVSDITISGVPGIAGLKPTLLMVKLSKKILIANKESIICGWNLIQKEAKKNKTTIVPVDSEHFSIMKLLENQKIKRIDKIYITASGGPFLDYKLEKMRKIKPTEALRHPTWKMGKKISIDSATLMNKILELIEAQKIFNIPAKKLEIIIHPNSLVHAIIKFKNGLNKFIYHETSMMIPLSNAIFDGDLKIIDFYKKKKKYKKKFPFENLFFKKVDPRIFPSILLKDRANEYFSTSIIINAANEILVDQFLSKKIPFLSIYKIIMSILKDRNYKKYAIRKANNIKQISVIDTWGRQKTLELVKKIYG